MVRRQEAKAVEDASRGKHEGGDDPGLRPGGKEMMAHCRYEEKNLFNVIDTINILISQCIIFLVSNNSGINIRRYSVKNLFKLI